MEVDPTKYGIKALDEEHYDYHQFVVKGLDMLAPERDKVVEEVVMKALKKLGSGWELDHINPGSPFYKPGEEVDWPTLWFRKPKSAV